MVQVLSILGFLALTAGTAVFVAAEYSLTTLERGRVETDYRLRNDRRAKALVRAHRHLSFQLSGAQLGITLTTLATGYLAEPVLADVLRPSIAFLVPEPAVHAVESAAALVVATCLSMVLGELVPKYLAIAKPLTLGRTTAPFQVRFSAFFAPVIRGLNRAANAVVRGFGVEPAEELRSARSPSELVVLVRNSAVHGALEKEEAQLIDRSLRFGERRAEEVMTPRSRIVALLADNTVDELLRISAETGHSRFPVLPAGSSEQVSDLDEALGFVHVRQAVEVPRAQRGHSLLGTLARPVSSVPATLDGDALMTQLRREKMQVVWVVDEYGGTAGIVTLEDLVEEIVGEVTDEHDDGEELAIQPVDPQDELAGWVCSGLLRTDELDEATGYRSPNGDFETVAGLVLHVLGRIPEVGDELQLPQIHADDEDETLLVPSSWWVRVLEMDGRRIDRLWLGERQTGNGHA
ncbi:MAG: hemolysin family protein [Segniliparus sp.]|uniref:hemolysin family protein n=1 Tax=Segniliparus sp. TaxID=2804064 RepID=UPI003F3F1109